MVCLTAILHYLTNEKREVGITEFFNKQVNRGGVNNVNSLLSKQQKI